MQSFENIIYNSNPAYGNITASLAPVNDSDLLLNVQINLKQDVQRITALLTLAMPKDKNDKNYERIVLKSPANICRLGQGRMGNFVSKMIMEEFGKYADFKVECPFLKVSRNNFHNSLLCNSLQGSYNINNFILSDKYVPLYLLQENVKYFIILQAMGKVAKSKSLVTLYTIKAFGEIQKN